jgi:hypothetical protein
MAQVTQVKLWFPERRHIASAINENIGHFLVKLLVAFINLRLFLGSEGVFSAVSVVDVFLCSVFLVVPPVLAAVGFRLDFLNPGPVLNVGFALPLLC